jgi:hypothetical protein
MVCILHNQKAYTESRNPVARMVQNMKASLVFEDLMFHDFVALEVELVVLEAAAVVPVITLADVEVVVIVAAVAPVVHSTERRLEKSSARELEEQAQPQMSDVDIDKVVVAAALVTFCRGWIVWSAMDGNT